MFSEQSDIILEAYRLVRGLPAGATWLVAVSDQDGPSEGQTRGSLDVMAMHPADLAPILDALGGEGAFSAPVGFPRLWVQITSGGLEVSVEEA